MRAFVAVEITDAGVIGSLGRVQERLGTGTGVGPQNMHFTLQFLGEIPDSDSGGIRTALRSIRFESFALSVSGVGAFPSARSARVVWAGVDRTGGRRLAELAGAVRGALSPLGFEPDRPFRPHVTILRTDGEDIAEDLKKLRDTEFGTQEIRRIKLKKSVLTPAGAVHSDLLEVKAV